MDRSPDTAGNLTRMKGIAGVTFHVPRSDKGFELSALDRYNNPDRELRDNEPVWRQRREPP